ncbi:MAG: hypothetical protein EOP82_00660 [Variovorax sp.]|nr:MAG: hypothetical protein EOP82_00660 [Variovorax sp.]
MAKLHDLDSSVLVPCRHCSALLQMRERFCPFCGEDQSVAQDAVDAVDTVPAIEADSEEVKSEIGLVRPGALWQQELPTFDGPVQEPGRPFISNRLMLGIVAALVLLVAALVHDIYLDRQHEAARLREFSTNVERTKNALGRGDLSGAQRVLEALDADHADDPGVQELRTALDRRVQEQAARREQLREAALKASRALGLGEPAAQAAQAPSPPSAPLTAASPAQAVRAADSEDKDCTGAISALALCARK